jgi:chromate transporter
MRFDALYGRNMRDDDDAKAPPIIDATAARLIEDDKPTDDSPSRAVSRLQLFSAFFRIGVTALGGGTTGWIHREIVMSSKWLTDDEFISGVAISQVLPGVNTTNLTVYVGHRLAGWTGALVALAGFLTGPFFIAVVTAVTYQRLLKIPYFDAAMTGIAAVALGMVLRVSLMSARRYVRELAPTLIMIAAFLSVGVFHWPLIPTIVVLAPISIYAARPRKAPADAR